MSNKIIKGDIFIIPNHLREWRKEFLFADELQKKLNTIGVTINDGDTMVQVWCCDSTSKNWQDHYDCPVYTDMPEDIDSRDRLFPGWFPVSLFEGKHEGDIVVLNYKGTTIELTLAQSKYRYNRFGEFQEVLTKLKWVA